jgi:hypothetical protein
MAASQEYAVDKLIVEMIVRDRRQAVALRGEVAEVCETVILPELEKILSQLSGAEEILLIDRVEIDAGFTSEGKLRVTLADAVCRQLEDKLPDIIAETRVRSSLSPAAFRTGRSGLGAVLSPPSAAEEVLVHFLKTGTLPWWAGRREYGCIDDLCADMLQGDPAHVRDFARRVCADPAAVRRFVGRFSGSICAELLAVLAPARAGSIQARLIDLVVTCEQSAFVAMPAPEIHRIFWRRVLGCYAQDRKMSAAADAATESVLDAMRRVTTTPRRTILATLRETAQKQSAFRSELPAWLFAAAGSEGRPQPDADEGRTDDARLGRLHIENAGLVLLWPYLRTFFEGLGLMQGGAFAGDKSVVRAICLLQKLVIPHDDVPEYDLALCKLLCGWPVLAPLETDFSLSEAEETEGDALLRTVVSHWSALKNTSVEGLRTSFLQRAGVLEERDDAWLLYVERKAYDLLLERLPWSLSVVKLSWMRKTLFVEWWK